MSRNYTGLGRYEQLFDQFDAAISRLESRCDKIERRVTNLQASKAAYRCYSSNYDTDLYQQPTRFRPCHEQPPGWPPPQRSPPSCWPTQRGRHTYGKQQQTHAAPRRQPTCLDPPERRIRQGVSAYNPQPPNGGPLRQQGYQPHEPPARMEPPDCIFRPLPQPPQPHCCRNAANDERCLGEVMTHTHSPKLDGCLDSYVCGYARELRDQDEDGSSSSSLVAPIGYSCENTRDFDYYSKRRMVEEEHCENLGDTLLMDSNFETEVEEECGHDASNSDATGVSISSIVLLGENQVGVEEKLLDDGPPQSAPILQLYYPNISKQEDCSIGEVEKKIASFNVAQMSSKDVKNCWFKRGGACTGVRIIAYIYVDFFDGDVPSIVHPSTSLDVDARFIPPRDTPYLSILGGDRGIRSAVRYAFDPGGDASPKLLLSTLVFGSWFPP